MAVSPEYEKVGYEGDTPYDARSEGVETTWGGISHLLKGWVIHHHTPDAPHPETAPPEHPLQNHGPVLQPKGEIEPIRDEAACLNAVSAVSTKPPLVTIQLAPAALQGRFKLSDPNRDRNRPPAISRQSQPNARSGGRLGAGNTNPASWALAVVGVYQKFANAVRKQTLLRSFTVRLRECRARGRSFTFVYYFGRGPPARCTATGQRRPPNAREAGCGLSWKVYSRCHAWSWKVYMVYMV